MYINCQNSDFPQEGLRPSSLTATDWAQWVPEQVEDGIIDVHVDESLQGLGRAHTLNILEDIDEIIGTPIRLVSSFDADTDIRIGARDSFEGITGPTAAGTAYIDGDLILNAYIRTDWLLETDKQVSFKRLLRRSRREMKGKKVKPLEQVLQAISKRVLTHEILHTFGLSHPDDNGLNPAWNDDDSVMSYNVIGGWKHGTNSDITALDAAALQSIWGVG